MMPLAKPWEVACHVENVEHGLWCPYCNLPSATCATGFAFMVVSLTRVADVRLVLCNDCGADLTSLDQEVEP